MKKICTLLFMAATAFTFAQTTSTMSTEEVNELQQAQETTPQPVQESTTQAETKKQGKNENEKKSAMPFIKKLYFGGTFGATFGDYTSITVAPTIGYRIKPSTYTGLKVYYTYSKQKFNGNNYEYHNYGFGTFLRWYAFSDVYLHVAPEILSYEYFSGGSSTREWVPYLWAGAGIRKRTSKRSWVSVHVLFDMLNDKNSPFEQWEPNVVIGAGTSF